MVSVRFERVEEYPRVRLVNELAFGRTNEADLVEALRSSACPHISMVALMDEDVVGHIFFSPVSIESADSISKALGLAPMSVLPEYQRRGIGSQLVREGLKECRRIDQDIVFVLGHPEYYPRFGFLPAKHKGLRCEYEVPDEAFMVIELTQGALSGRRGLIKYRPEFGMV